MPSTASRIAIVGAGPAGLCLSRILQLNSINSIVFERDTSASHRDTLGGCLDLHDESGQAALREAGLWYEFQRYARYDGQAYIISDDTGKRWVNMQASQDLGRPEIDRPDLCRVLLNSLQPGSVRWGYKLLRADLDGTLHFEVATTGEGTRHVVESGFDLVVGADGAWSKIRTLLTTIPAFYAGTAGYEAWIHDPDNKCPDVSRYVGSGSHFAFGRSDERCLVMQRQTDRSIQLYAYMRKPDSWHAHNSVTNHGDREQVKACLLDEFASWPPETRMAITAINGPVLPRALHMLPVGARWNHRAGLTAIGDAAHLMTPFAGEGVNQALHDAMMLAKEIVAADVAKADCIDAAAERYERDMFPRARAFMQATWDSYQERLEPKGNERLAEAFHNLIKARTSGASLTSGTAPDMLFARE